MSLPHRFPFELVDRVDGRAARLRPSAGSWWRGGTGLGLPWLVEAAAQATARVLGAGGDAGEGEDLSLGGVESARLDRPVDPGSDVELRPRIERRMGEVTRAVVAVEIDGAVAGEVTLLLVRRAAAQRL